MEQQRCHVFFDCRVQASCLVLATRREQHLCHRHGSMSSVMDKLCLMCEFASEVVEAGNGRCAVCSPVTFFLWILVRKTRDA